MQTGVPALAREGGSFRDPDSAVFVREGAIVRGLSERGLADWERVSASRFFADALADGRIVASEPAAPEETPAGFAAALRHERLPFVSYPYEWPFSMLKDAALLQLDLLYAALAEDVILKDATPYNVQWRGARPVFVDVGSFEPLREGQPWIGYRQFCMQFLYPLMLRAYKGVSHRPWLRGSLRGIAPEDFARLLSRRDRVRPGVFSHVYLHARLEQRSAGKEEDVEGELRRAGFRKELVVANVRKLRKVVAGLEWGSAGSAWTGYRAQNTYSDADDAGKVAFVQAVLGERTWPLVWDLGCNDGRYARLAADAGAYVVAVDSDEAVTDGLYRELAREGDVRILPLALDLSDPSPGLGWRGGERKPPADRGRPDLTLCLALVHHLAITESIPLPEIAASLAELGGAVVVELPTPEDPMVERLRAAKRSGSLHPYGVEEFERALEPHFRIERREELPSRLRVLYFAVPR